MPIDCNSTLLNGQHPSSLAEIAKIRNLLYREGIGPSMHTLKLNIAIATTMVTEILEDPGTTHLKAIKCDFRDLRGTRDINFKLGDEENDLPIFVDSGGVLQQEGGLYPHGR